MAWPLPPSFSMDKDNTVPRFHQFAVFENRQFQPSVTALGMDALHRQLTMTGGNAQHPREIAGAGVIGDEIPRLGDDLPVRPLAVLRMAVGK